MKAHDFSRWGEMNNHNMISAINKGFDGKESN